MGRVLLWDHQLGEQNREDWIKLATPDEISDEELSGVVALAYERGIEPRRVLRTIFAFSPGGSSLITPQRRRLEFIAALSAFRTSRFLHRFEHRVEEYEKRLHCITS
jgi:hypothetical protein